MESGNLKPAGFRFPDAAIGSQWFPDSPSLTAHTVYLLITMMQFELRADKNWAQFYKTTKGFKLCYYQKMSTVKLFPCSNTLTRKSFLEISSQFLTQKKDLENLNFAIFVTTPYL